ncbi:MAG: exodeoxyribonuclease VII large subunit, partial [Spirochaetales bacterium]|nr:exodeoxyribonuclease VII large subunit [Spirochaetales bacterium]
MEQQIFSVSAVTQLLKEVIEATFSRITVEGEISNFRPSGAGHWYFTLKDSRAALSAVMFKFKTFGVRERPKDGQRVRVTGTLSVYEVRGTYQIICETIHPLGKGDILELLEQRKQQFLQEGLFEQSRKQPMPLAPKHISVITSATGAALRDVLSVLKRRNANVRISILPATVQGERAAVEIAAMISYANTWSIGDVMIVGRGGGSLEDLLPFSEEIVVRTAAASKIPVISAVGHETDWSLLDYAADLRAPTPSAAAEMVTAEQLSLLERIQSGRQTFSSVITRTLQHRRTQITHMSSGYLADPLIHRIRTNRMRQDEVRESLSTAVGNLLTAKKHRIELL